MPPNDPREIRTVTILFSDLSGFTAMSEHLDPEEVTDIVDGLFRRFRPLIESRGGTIDKFIGDAVMAVFGAPTAHEDDPARAVAAGLAMQRELGAFNGERGLTLRMRVGIHTGSILWGSIGGARATATGDAVVLAQRLESTARPGTVHVSLVTARAARKQFRFEDRDQVSLKGRPETVEAFVAVDARPEAPDADSETPFAGREKELARLREIWEAGRGGFVLIEGEAGVGKSRLVAELRRLVGRSSPGAWIGTGRAAEGVRVPLAPLGDALRGESTLDPAGAARLADSIAARLRTGEPDPIAAETSAHLILLSLGVTLPGARTSGIGPARLEAEVRRAWTAWLSARAPALLCLEDLHLADEATVSFLEALPASTAGRPLVVVATARPGGRTPAGFETLHLGEMPRPEILRVASSVFAAPLHSALEDFLFHASGGNPYYAEELARYLLEENLVSDSPLVLRPGPHRVPAGLEGLLVARLDALPLEHRETLKGASVLGRVFWAGLLGKVLERDVERSVDEARSRDLVRPEEGSSLPDDREFAFRHALLRDAAYSLLTKKDRARLHAAAAALLEKRAARDGPRLFALAARHREAAGQSAEAADGWLRAARGAYEAGFPAEALGMSRESSRCAPSGDARLVAAQSLQILGRYPEAEIEARGAAEGPVPAGSAAWSVPMLMAQLRERTGDYSASLEFAGKALAAAPGAQERARSHYLRGVTLEAMSRFAESLASLDAAERELGDRDDREARDLMANLWSNRGIVDHRLGRFESALRSHERALEIFRAMSKRAGVANTWIRMGNSLDRMGRTREALELFLRAADELREVGNLAGVASCRNNIGIVLNRQGDYDGALLALRDAAARHRALGAPAGEANSLNNIAMVLTGMGRPAEALEEARRALAIRVRIGDRMAVSSSHAQIGQTLVVLGDTAGAREAIRESLVIRREFKDNWGSGRCLLELGEIEGSTGNAAAALPLFFESAQLFRQSNALYDLQIALRKLEDLLEILGQAEEARAAGEEAAEVERRLAEAGLRTS